MADKDQFSSRNSGPNRAATPKSAAPVETKAGDWWNARQRGERLSAHQLHDEQCDLCGVVKPDVTKDPISGLFACQPCIEEMAYAPH